MKEFIQTVKDNKKLAILSLVMLLAVIGGMAYAIFNYAFTGNQSTISVGPLSVTYLEGTNKMNITNALPISDEQGKTSDSFDFVVKSNTSRNVNLVYTISLEKLSASSGYTSLDDSDIDIYLTSGNKVLKNVTKVSDLNNNELYRTTHVHNSTNREVQTKYSLRAWIDSGVDASSWKSTTKLEYKFRVNVNALEVEPVTQSVTTGQATNLNISSIGVSASVPENGTTIKELTLTAYPGGETFNVSTEEREIPYEIKLTDASGNDITTTSPVAVQINIGTGLEVKSMMHGSTQMTKDSSHAADTYEYDYGTGILTMYVTHFSEFKINVKSILYQTVLYNDGLLIINESAKDRTSNIEEHGTITKTYNALSKNNPYIMTATTDQPWYNETGSIKSIEIGSIIKPTSTAYWFTSLTKVSKVDVTKLDTSNTSSMYQMFAQTGNDSSVTSFNITGLNDLNTLKVTNMNRMFSGAGKSATTWNIGDLSLWNTSNVTDMAVMFQNAGYNASEFNIGDLSSWDTSKVTNMMYMFNKAGFSATTWNIGDLSNWDVSNVTDLNTMFQYAGHNAETFNIGNLSSWDTSKVTNMSYMFFGASPSLGPSVSTTWYIGDLSNWNVSNVTNMKAMFRGAGYYATTWNIGDLSSWDTSKVIDMEAMFADTGRKASTKVNPNASGWNVSNVTNHDGFNSGASWITAPTWVH